MIKLTAALALCLLLAACSTLVAERAANDDSGYFADATGCYQASLRKEQIKIPRPLGFGKTDMITINIPTVYDPGFFTNCMGHARHVTPTTDPETYLQQSSNCLNAARDEEKPDSFYGQCIRRQQALTGLPQKN